MTEKICIAGVDYLAVKVPKAIDYFYHPQQNMLECLIAYADEEDGSNDIQDIMLPKENDYEMLGVISEITPVMWRQLLGTHVRVEFMSHKTKKVQWFNYDSGQFDSPSGRQCGLSLMKKMGVPEDYVLLKIIEGGYSPLARAVRTLEA